MTDLEIHAYNVGFGDAILVRVPREQPEPGREFWTILIDGGNAFARAGGDDDRLLTAMERIHEKTDGVVDLYIMTHEHLDHVQGPLLLQKKSGKTFTAHRVWMTSSAEPGYYDSHPGARERRRLADEIIKIIETQKALLSMTDQTKLNLLLALNNYRGTKDCVAHIRERIPNSPDDVNYIHADLKRPLVARSHGIPDVEIEVLAPEEDTSCYYGRIRPLTMAAAAGNGDMPLGPANPIPPPGVAMADFYRLVKSRESGFFGNALMIDKAGNDSSIVFLLLWKNRRLLFAADAEERSWHHIRKRVELEKVDFLKISHHGSRNGTPRDLLDALLGEPGVVQSAKALVSTMQDQYRGVPDDALMSELNERCDLYDTRNAEAGQAVTLTIPPLL